LKEKDFHNFEIFFKIVKQNMFWKNTQHAQMHDFQCSRNRLIPIVAIGFFLAKNSGNFLFLANYFLANVLEL